MFSVKTTIRQTAKFLFEFSVLRLAFRSSFYVWLLLLVQTVIFPPRTYELEISSNYVKIGLGNATSIHFDLLVVSLFVIEIYFDFGLI